MKSIWLYEIIFLSSLFFSCKEKNDKDLNIVNTTPLMESVISGFIKSLSEQNNQDHYVITAYTHSQNDSVILSIWHAYPDLGLARFRGVKEINGYRVCFVGETNKNLFTFDKDEKAPEDIIDFSMKPYNLEESFFVHPKEWVLYLRNDRIIGYYPEKEIEKFLAL